MTTTTNLTALETADLDMIFAAAYRAVEANPNSSERATLKEITEIIDLDSEDKVARARVIVERFWR